MFLGLKIYQYSMQTIGTYMEKLEELMHGQF